MAVIRIAQGGDDKQFLADLPIVRDIGAVVVQGCLIDITGIGAFIRIGWIRGVRECVDACLFVRRLSRYRDACSLAVFVMIVCTDSDIVLVMCHHTDRCLDHIVLAIEIIEIEMTIRYPFAKNMIVHVGIMLCLIEAHAVVRMTRLLLPVNAEIIAPCVLRRRHSDPFSCRKFSERRILFQILRLAICREGEGFIFAECKFGAQAHRIALAVVLHRCAVIVVEEGSGLAPAIGEVHVRAAAEVARRVADAVVILAAARLDQRSLGRQANALLMGDLRDDVDDAADGIRPIACRA